MSPIGNLYLQPIFYAYYGKFGPSIGQFYTILTISAALIPICFSIYCKRIKSDAFKYAVVASVFAILFVSTFYIYFKGANEAFYQAAHTEVELAATLVTWSYWHWGRIIVEFISLAFLIIAIDKFRSN